MDATVCEWRPGSNRSLVDPIVAVARLDMPAPMRAMLIEKLRHHQFDDVVTIRWASITSNSHANDYEAVISNMNFSQGSLCKTVTRNSWSINHEEGALVYIVDGRAFGYAAVCGNLFELQHRERIARSAPPESDLLTESVVPSSVLPSSELPRVDMPLPGVPAVASGAAVITGIPTYGPLIYSVSPTALVSTIPEPSTWALLGMGLIVVLRRVQR